MSTCSIYARAFYSSKGKTTDQTKAETKAKKPVRWQGWHHRWKGYNSLSDSADTRATRRAAIYYYTENIIHVQNKSKILNMACKFIQSDP